MTRRPVLVGLLALAPLAAVAACSGGDDDTASTSPPTPPVTEVAATDPPPSTEAVVATDPTVADTEPPPAVPAAFERVVPGGDCQCSDGSEFSFWVREADPEKVLFYFQGGGACFSAETCAEGGPYKRQALGDDPNGLATGIWDQDEAANPFAGWSVVFVPYCTGDVHLGSATTDYGDGLTIQHKGYLNGSAALAELVARFPGAAEVFVTGESAGGVPSPLFAGLVADALPDARVTALADSSGAYPDVAPLNAGIGALWGTEAAIPDWPETAGITTEQWSIPGLFSYTGRHDPDIALARFDFDADRVQAQFTGLVGLDASDLQSLILQNEQQIEASGVDLASWLAAGSDHTILSSPAVYTHEVGGQRLIDWITALVAGEEVPDVRCETCG